MLSAGAGAEDRGWGRDCRHKPLIEAFEDADWWIAFITWVLTNFCL